MTVIFQAYSIMVKYYGRARLRIGSVNTNQPGLKMSGCPPTVGKSPRNERYTKQRSHCGIGVCGPRYRHDKLVTDTACNWHCMLPSPRTRSLAGGVGRINSPRLKRTNCSGEHPTQIIAGSRKPDGSCPGLFGPSKTKKAVGCWAPFTPLTHARAAHTLVEARGKLYAIGGLGSFPSAGAPIIAPLTSVEAYDTTTGNNGTWDNVAPLITGRQAHTSTYFMDRIYTIGGLETADVLAPRLANPTVEYNDLKNGWTVGRRAYAAPSLNRAYHQALVAPDTFGECLYVLGGSATYPNVLNSVWRLGFPDAASVKQGPDAMLWKEMPARMPLGRMEFGATTLGGFVYIFGGLSRFGPTESVAVYEPPDMTGPKPGVWTLLPPSSNLPAALWAFAGFRSFVEQPSVPSPATPIMVYTLVGGYRGGDSVGQTPSTAAYQFSPITESWTKVKSIDGGGVAFAAAASVLGPPQQQKPQPVNYIVGGNKEPLGVDYPKPTSNTFLCVDSAREAGTPAATSQPVRAAQWQPLPSLPNPRWHHVAGCMNVGGDDDALFVVGGVVPPKVGTPGAAKRWPLATDSCLMLLNTDTGAGAKPVVGWRTMAPYPWPRVFSAGVVNSGTSFAKKNLFGNQPGDAAWFPGPSPPSEVAVYVNKHFDGAEGFNNKNMVVNRLQNGTLADGKWYVTGGAPRVPCIAQTNAARYNPYTGEWEKLMELLPEQKWNEPPKYSTNGLQVARQQHTMHVLGGTVWAAGGVASTGDHDQAPTASMEKWGAGTMPVEQFLLLGKHNRGWNYRDEYKTIAKFNSQYTWAVWPEKGVAGWPQLADQTGAVGFKTTQPGHERGYFPFGQHYGPTEEKSVWRWFVVMPASLQNYCLEDTAATLPERRGGKMISYAYDQGGCTIGDASGAIFAPGESPMPWEPIVEECQNVHAVEQKHKKYQGCPLIRENKDSSDRNDPHCDTTNKKHAPGALVPRWGANAVTLNLAPSLHPENGAYDLVVLVGGAACGGPGSRPIRRHGAGAWGSSPCQCHPYSSFMSFTGRGGQDEVCPSVPHPGKGCGAKNVLPQASVLHPFLERGVDGYTPPQTALAVEEGRIWGSVWDLGIGPPKTSGARGGPGELYFAGGLTMVELTDEFTHLVPSYTGAVFTADEVTDPTSGKWSNAASQWSLPEAISAGGAARGFSQDTEITGTQNIYYTGGNTATFAILPSPEGQRPLLEPEFGVANVWMLSPNEAWRLLSLAKVGFISDPLPARDDAATKTSRRRGQRTQRGYTPGRHYKL